MAEIDRQSSARPMSDSQYRRYCPGDPACRGSALVCERNGRVVGFAVYSWVLDEGSIINIAVHGELRRHGIGSRLLRGCLGAMRQAGLARCLLEVRESNQAAQSLYGSEGFEFDGRRPRYYTTESGDREDALLMSLQL